MKIRHDFISNSSSCSFIVISNEGEIQHFDKENQTLILPDKSIGETKFGWEWKRYRGVGSKLNFCALQLIYIYARPKNISKYASEETRKFNNERDKYLTMFKNVCKKHFNIEINLKSSNECFEEGSYIDHNSNIDSGVNFEMFDSEENLVNFLTKSESNITTGNDNEEAFTVDADFM